MCSYHTNVLIYNYYGGTDAAKSHLLIMAPRIQERMIGEVSGQRMGELLQKYLKIKKDKVVALKTKLNPSTVSTCSLLAMYINV